MTWGMDEDAEDLDEEEVEPEPDDATEETEEVDDSWGSDVQDLDDDDYPDEDETFAEEFAGAVSQGTVENIAVRLIEDHYKEIDDADLLREALEQDTRTSAGTVYERRLRQLDEGNSDDVSPEEADDKQSDDGSDEDEVTDEEESSSEDGWGVDEDEVEEVDQSELEEMGVDNLADDTEDDTSEDVPDLESVDAAPVDDDVQGIADIDVSGIAPNAMDTKEASKKPYLWRILGWAPPGRGKTHFGFTMPQPVCIIDTEGKAHNLASKFEDKVTYIWQPDDYDGARDALDEAITVLSKYLEKGHRGTIVVDSMSEMWEWSKQKYVSKAYQGKSLDEVNLSSNMGRSGESDWKIIKRYHNKRFREVMTDTPFHLYWTAMQTDDYEAIMEGDDSNPKKPVGERDNGYKVDQVIRFVEGPDGKPQGQLQKSGSISKYAYDGLEYPTFPKHKQVCEEIRDLEIEGKDPMLEEVFEGKVRVIEGNPGRWGNDD